MPKIWNPSFGSVSTIVYSRRRPCDFRPTVSRGKLRAIGREGERAVVERINRVGADFHEAGEIAGHGRPGPEIVARAAGEGGIAVAVVRAGAVREIGGNIVLVNKDVFSCAPLITIGVSSMTPTSNLPRPAGLNWLFAASWPPTAMERSSRSRSLFENPLLVQRICRGVVEAVQRVIDLVGQRERELAIRDRYGE